MPFAYSEAERKQVIEHLCNEISNGRSMAEVLREDQILRHGERKTPSVFAVIDWLDQSGEFKQSIERAREAGAEKLLGEIVDIADNTTGDVYIDEHGKPRIDGDCVQRAKLKVYARERYAAKIAPRRFGDKLDLTSAGEKLATPQTNVTMVADNRVQTLIALAAQRKEEKAKLLDD